MKTKDVQSNREENQITKRITFMENIFNHKVKNLFKKMSFFRSLFL